MKMRIVEKDGKKWLEMVTEYKGNVNVDYAMIYGWGKKPYIKRLNEKMHLTPAMLNGETVTY